ncbi:MAG: hypothetical protein ACD_45C00675G0001, partial [uncultured bacterium]
MASLAFLYPYTSVIKSTNKNVNGNIILNSAVATVAR